MSITQILATYSSISFESLSKLKLFNRVDRKFVFSLRDFNAILKKLADDYFVVTVNGALMSNYKTQYFDTSDFSMYTQHHNGKLNRYKVRLRSYVDSDSHFFELKFKDNSGRTHKSRIAIDGHLMQNDEKVINFLDQNSPFKISHLLPSLMVDYHRITLVNKQMTERLTLDINLKFSIDNDHSVFYDNIVIAELKQGRSSVSPFIDTMNDLRVKKLSLSKYLLGMASLNKIIKTNNYKDKIRYVEKFQSNNE